MVLEEIKNEDMVKKGGLYADPLIFTEGYIVVRAFATTAYTKEDGKGGDAWLPWIYIFMPKEDSPVKIGGPFIVAKGPAEAYGLSFRPTWERDIIEDKDVIHVFKKAFVSEGSIGDFLVRKLNLTGINDDNNLEPGRLSYSGIDYRDVTLHGNCLDDLEKMLTLVAENIPNSRMSYDLEFSSPQCAHSDKKYNFQTSHEEISEFVKKAVESLYTPK